MTGISPLVQSRVAGAFWMLCVITSIYGYFPGRGTHLGKDASLVAGAAYLVVTILLYTLLRPVNSSVALLAAGFGLVGIATSGDSSAYFGVQCILVGYLVVLSTFLPRAIGVLMILAGLGQLLFFSTLLPEWFTSKYGPIGYVADGVGEIAFALWLLFMGVNVARWQMAASREQTTSLDLPA